MEFIALALLILGSYFYFLQVQKKEVDKNLEQLITNSFDLEKDFEKKLSKVITYFSKIRSSKTSIISKKDCDDRIKDFREIEDRKYKIKDLNTHLQKKYENDPKIQLSVQSKYNLWLLAQCSILDSYENHWDDLSTILERRRREYLEAVTIENSMIALADSNVLKILALVN